MILRATILTVLICLSVSAAYAEFTVSPGVSLHMEYNDNIFLEPDQEDDFIMSVSPTISLDWEISLLKLSLNAGVTGEKYLDHSEEDSLNVSLDQPSTVDVLLNMYRELLFLRITDTYSRVKVDEGGRGGEGITTLNLTDSNSFQVNPYLQFLLTKDTHVTLSYTYEDLWYEDDGDDANNHLYAATITQNLSDRISMSLSGSYNQYRPKSPSSFYSIGSGGVYEYDRQSANVALTFQATDRLRLNGSYGHTWFDYDVRSDVDSNVWSAGADYELSSNYTTGISFSNDYALSVEDGPKKSEHQTAYLAYNDRFTLKASVFSDKSNLVESDQDDDSYGGELSGELPLNAKVGVTGLIRYTNFDRTGTDADQFDRYSTKVSLYYETRLGRLSAGHTYNRNNSRISANDYSNNIIFVDASLRF